MIEYMLADVIGHEFDRVAGKGQYKSGKALHVGFGMNTGNLTDQYRVCHLYVYAPYNYAYVAIQEERIDRNGKRHVQPMELLCYHDSCWRDAIQTFIFKRRDDFSTFRSLGSLSDWCDVLVLTEEEREYLHLMDALNSARGTWEEERRKKIGEMLKVNPFDKRTIWKNC